MKRRGRPSKAKDNANGGERKQKPARFFKIILPSILQQNKLRIPAKFARGLNLECPTIATFSVPTGLTWKVAIAKSDDKLYFTQGWEQFVKHNSIRYGYVLQFEYKGKNHHFRVHIFDLSCCEIDYPLENPPPNRCKKKDHRIQVKEEEVEHEEVPLRFAMPEINCENPSFTIVVQRSYFTRNGMYVPSSFANAYLKGKSKKSAKLVAEDGREWALGCHYSRRINRVELINGLGWKNFMQDNDLDVGNAVTFELMGENHNSITLKFCKKKV